MEKKSKKKYLIGALAVLLVAVAVGGTIAWLTASNSVKNNFTVGEITEPTTPPGNEPKPGEDDKAHLNGNIYEIFEENSKIIPGVEIQKRPWVGVGQGSEPSYVFAYIDNRMMSETAGAEDWANFTLNAGWAPLENQSDGYNWTSGHYTGGLFMWVGKGSTTTADVLSANETNDVWTDQPVFDNVIIPESAVASDFTDKPVMEVHCFIIAATEDVDTAKAISEAVAWANDPSNPLATIQGTAATQEP